MSAPVAKSTLLTHFDYTLWATSLLLDAATRLSPDELTRDLKVSCHSILATLQHIYYADRIWLKRFQGETAAFADPDPGPSLEDLKSEWPRLMAKYNVWLNARSDSDFAETFTAQRLNGTSFTVPYWQALLHVVNHGTMHRGQVMAMLRQLGHTPPSTDMFLYYLQRQV